MLTMELTAEAIEEIQARLGYEFRDRRLLNEAFMHDSFVKDLREPEIGSNERLEFLGDALIGLVVGETLFRRRPDASEGRLSLARSRLVSARELAEACRRLGLAEFLFLSRGEEQTGGRERTSNLASLLEALAGAIYLDGGYGEAARFLQEHLIEPGAAGLEIVDPKSELQERVQAVRGEPPSYAVIEEVGPSHRPVFTVDVRVGDRILGQGRGSNKKTAERAAARAALRKLDEEPSALRERVDRGEEKVDPPLTR